MHGWHRSYIGLQCSFRVPFSVSSVTNSTNSRNVTSSPFLRDSSVAFDLYFCKNIAQLKSLLDVELFISICIRNLSLTVNAIKVGQLAELIVIIFREVLSYTVLLNLIQLLKRNKNDVWINHYIFFYMYSTAQ